jgi:hypothetical protein
MRWSLKRMILAGCGLLLAAGAAHADGVLVVQSRDFAGTAAGVAVGSRLRLESVQVTDTGETRALSLERFQVFADGATITVHGDAGDRVLPAPANAYFRGEVEGKPGSRAFLARLEDGRAQGMIEEDGTIYLIGDDSAPAKALGDPLEMHRVDAALLKSSRAEGFNCGEDQLPKGPGAKPVLDFTAAAAAPAEPVDKAVAAHTAKVAIETDFEFYAIFNNATTATNYIANLIGYSSTIYTSEINTALTVQSVSLWSTSNDPWTQTSTLCGLFEFGKYWNQFKTGVPRTTAHFMSGRNLGGGIAWLGVLCGGSFNTGGTVSCPGLGAESTPWGGAYGFTASLTGGFNVNSPSAVWDIISVSHEIGHNFNSPHTHCYAGIGGNASPIDQCWSGESGCYSGTTSLPGPAGAGSGTLMSYCHQLSGGYSNISLNFGTGHPYGVQPGREAAQMSGYVSSVASVNPACLAPALPGLLSDGFESGSMASWH